MGFISFNLDHASPDPLFRQLYRQLRQAILDGSLSPGQRLPSSRALAGQVGIGRITAVQAYDLLKAEGFVKIRPGAGTFVSKSITHPTPVGTQEQFVPHFSSWGQHVLANASLERVERHRLEIDFGFGRSFPHIFPYSTWRRLLARYLSTDDVMLSRYGSPEGFFPLRSALANYLVEQRGVQCTPGQVIIVSGAQQALDILARLLITAGDQVIVETPGYRDAFTLFQAHGATLIPKPVDDNGLPVADLPENRQARMVFVTPSHQFPRGGTLPLERRLALLDWARRQEALIIEDDYDSELRYDGHPLSALQGLDDGGHVIYLGTFSKVLFPALRLGYVVLPPALVQPFSRSLALVDRGAPTLTQAAVADFIAEGHFESHLRRLRAAYGERRRALVEALENMLPGDTTFSRVPAGLHIMLYLNPQCDEAQVIRRAVAANVGVYPGAPYHLQKPAPPSILLGYSGLNIPQIEEGVRRLAEVVPRCR